MRLTKQDIEELARDALNQYGLNEVSFNWDNSKRRFGQARYKWADLSKRTIAPRELSLSLPLCMACTDEDEILDTILHEIAHLLVTKRTGKNQEHNAQWKRVCIEIGARPVAKYDFAIMDDSKLRYKYTATCPNGCVHNFSKMGRIWRTGGYRCCKHNKPFEVVQNY